MPGICEEKANEAWSFPANEGLKCTNNNICASRCPWGGTEGRWV